VVLFDRYGMMVWQQQSIRAVNTLDIARFADLPM
jgi:hypothetical protein